MGCFFSECPEVIAGDVECDETFNLPQLKDVTGREVIIGQVQDLINNKGFK